MKPHFCSLKNSVEVSILINRLYFVSLVACVTGWESHTEIQLLESGPASLPVLRCDNLDCLHEAAPAWDCFREYTDLRPPSGLPSAFTVLEPIFFFLSKLFTQFLAVCLFHARHGISVS